jgi:hypothetical protein
MSQPGRVCPVRYRYAPDVVARSVERSAATLYVVGGLYGNLRALDAIEIHAVLRRAATRHPDLLAAGMPNASGTHFGILTRIGTSPSPHAALYGVAMRGVAIDAQNTGTTVVS